MVEVEVHRDSEAVPVPAQVLQGIRKVHADDNINEYSVHEVAASALRLGEKDALEWLLRHHVRYLDGMFNGFFIEEE
jgi:hypothetical protein